MALTSVEISSVRKTFGPTVALGGVNLKAYAGEVHAIVGGNGSGKSTLAKVISGILIPDGGQISILGKAATSPVEARALGVANVFQEVLVADACSVLDNLFLGADGLFAAPLRRDEKMARATALLNELLGFHLDPDVLMGELPLSTKQWVTIARALLTEPKVLILDESSAALDFESTERLFRKIRQLKANGATILIVTHRIAELVRIADRATVLRDGVDVGCLEKDEITEVRILELIAGERRQAERQSRPLSGRQGVKPLLDLRDVQVWPHAERITLTLYPGEVVGVTGLDGQGQADFVRSIAGVQQLASGQVSVIQDGVATEVEGLRGARENRISYVSGDRKRDGVFPNLSIFENLLLPVLEEYGAGGPLHLINRPKLEPVFEWESGKLAVKMGSRDNPITSLSGGNQQKVLIARAFAEKPSVLVLNDPARGIDIGAKLDLYRNLRDFAERGGAVLFLSSEIEEFLHLCTRVHVFRNGAIWASFEPPYDGHVILNAMFGRRGSAALPGEVVAAEEEEEAPPEPAPARPRFDSGRPLPRAITPARPPRAPLIEDAFALTVADMVPGQVIPQRYAEDSLLSPRIVWSGAPAGTRSFALSVTDPDLPPEFRFPRAFAHWLVFDIPATIRELPEGASRTKLLPAGARELNSDYVTFSIPGFGRGYGGPWPPDRAHRYVFTLYALTAETLSLAPDADLAAFSAAVLPTVIRSTSFTAIYGPASKPLPSAQQTAEPARNDA
jgi:Raf kinase inhibitor-like YbhB/YbcL family protein